MSSYDNPYLRRTGAVAVVGGEAAGVVVELRSVVQRRRLPSTELIAV